jgi:hypothetical protein
MRTKTEEAKWLQYTYLILSLELDVLVIVQVDGVGVGGVDDVGKSTFVNELTVVCSAVSGEEHSLALGVVAGDVTDDTGKAMHGMRALDVTSSGVGAVLERHDCSFSCFGS